MLTDLPTLLPWLLVAALAVAAVVLAIRSGSPWVHRVVAILLVPLALLLGAWAWWRDDRRRVADRNAEVDRQRDDRVREAEVREAREVERARVAREADDARTREAEAEARRVREADVDAWLNGERRGR